MKSENERFEDAFDAILKWYKSDGETPLSASLEGRRQRWIAAREWMVAIRPLTDSETVKYLVSTYQVSEPQAWRDIRDTKRFFATMEATNKEFEKVMLIAQIKSLRTTALFNGDLKTAAKCDDNLIKLNHFDQPQDTDQAPRQIKVSIDFNPARIGAKPIPNLEAKVAAYIGEKAKRELMIEDVDFEPVNEKDDDQSAQQDQP
ncbi:hypothetical protein ACFQ4C_18025 [Larkinella insperata]|uniref:Uncharacterized protein n=1 Tax=Larkinella insperata TaxID=332158 RepID=A0ABW3QNB4_9BACT|nr:hypothetical protein [Larkinella insperata]